MMAVAQQDRIDVWAVPDGDQPFLRIVQINSNGEEDVIVVSKSEVGAFVRAIKSEAEKL